VSVARPSARPRPELSIIGVSRSGTGRNKLERSGANNTGRGSVPLDVTVGCPALLHAISAELDPSRYATRLSFESIRRPPKNAGGKKDASLFDCGACEAFSTPSIACNTLLLPEAFRPTITAIRPISSSSRSIALN